MRKKCFISQGQRVDLNSFMMIIFNSLCVHFKVLIIVVDKKRTTIRDDATKKITQVSKPVSRQCHRVTRKVDYVLDSMMVRLNFLRQLFFFLDDTLLMLIKTLLTLVSTENIFRWSSNKPVSKLRSFCSTSGFSTNKKYIFN